jgi:hypothetical protein
MAAVLATESISSSAPRRVPLDVSVSSSESTVTAEGGISCGEHCDASYRYGSIVDVIARPGNSETFVRWGGDCAGVASICSVLLERSTRVRAVFVPIVRNVRLTVGGPGTVVGEPMGLPAFIDEPASIRCGTQAALCSATFGQGRTITLKPAADPDGVFAGWGGACEGQPLDPARCSLTVGVNEQVTNRVTAWFRHRVAATGPQTLTVDAKASREVSSTSQAIPCQDVCSEQFASAAAVTLSGDVTDWSGDCVGSVDRCTVVIDAPVNVVARSAQSGSSRDLSYAISVSVSRGGRVTTVDGSRIVCDGPGGKRSKCEADFTEDSSVKLAATPRRGFRFVRWADPDCKKHARPRGRCNLIAYDSLKIRAVFGSR